MKKVVSKFSSNLLIVIMLGLVSTTTAWAAIQSSLHGGEADDASSEYALVLADANNLWITAEVKYRNDLDVWRDKQVRVLLEGMDREDFFTDIRTASGSSELYEFAMDCFIEDPTLQLPECTPYMDAVYDPYTEMWDSGDYYWELANAESEYSSTLQMLTGLFAVALFLLGITAVMQIRNLVAYLVMFSILLWLFGVGVLVTIPTVLL